MLDRLWASLSLFSSGVRGNQLAVGFLAVNIGMGIRVNRFDRWGLGTVVLSAALVCAGCGGRDEAQMLASAQAALAKGDSAAAAVELRAALQLNPAFSAARFELGKMYLRQGNVSAAEIELRKLLPTTFNRAQLVPALAKVQLASGRWQKLVDEFGSTKLEDAAAMGELDAAVAVAYGYLGRIDDAKTRADAALRLKPDATDARLVLVRLAAGAGDLAGGQAQLDQTLKSDPTSADAWQLNGDLAIRAGSKPEEALKSYQKALQIQPFRVDSHAAAVGLLLSQRDFPAARKQYEAMRSALPSNPQTIVFQAQFLYLDGKYKEAQVVSAQLLKLLPDHIGVLQMVGAAEIKTGALIAAEAHLGKAVKLAPDSASARRLLAQAYLAGGQSAKALDVLDRNLKTGRPDVDSIAMAAEAHLQAGNAERANELFQQALRANPGDPKIRTAVAVAKISKGQGDLGFAELQDIASVDRDIVADKALISARFAKSDPDGALLAIDGLEKKIPKLPLAPTLRGQAWLMKKDMTAARQAFDAALTRDPAYFSAATALAKMDLADQKVDVAAARYQSVLKADPGSAQSHIALAELSAMRGESRAVVLAHYEAAIRAKPADELPRRLFVHYLLARKDFKGAQTAAQAAVAAIPDSLELLDTLGQVLASAGDFNQAIGVFNRVLSARPNSIPTMMHTAGAYSLSGNKKSAEQMLRRAAAVAPNDINLQRELIGLAVAERDTQKALMIARAIQARNPKQAIGFVLEADIHLIAGNRPAALGAFESAKTKDIPGKLPSRLHFMFMTDKNKVAADAFADDWLKKHPGDIDFIQYLGDISFAQGDFEVAERRYRQLIAQGKATGGALNNLAWLMLSKNSTEALMFAERAAAAVPDSAEILDTLAQALLVRKELQRALEVQKKSLALSPSSDVIKLHLAEILAKSGDKAGARAQLTALMQTSGEFSQKRNIPKMLAEL